MLENFYLNKVKILSQSQNLFYQNLARNLEISKLKIGCELEFYIFNHDKSTIADKKFIADFANILSAKIEQGEGQVEYIFPFTDDISKLAIDIQDFKKRVFQLANQHNIIASFEGMPLIDDCGNAMQFNISLHGDDDKNLFFKNSPLINFCANGLLDLTNSMLLILSPNFNDYLRHNLAINKNLFNKSKYTSPINLSLGNDNRSCAIRLANSSAKPHEKRLEYRVASANCDEFLALSAIIFALEYGLTKQQNNYPIIYGNAFDDCYKLEKIIDDFKTSQQFFAKENNLVRKRFLNLSS
jgi:glutamine synthetase